MNNQIEIYQGIDGQTQIEVKFEQDTIWLNQKQLGALFGKDSDTIGLHLRNIYKDEELDEISTTEDFSVVQEEGKRKVNRFIKSYNLDAIISVGYRVNSKRGIQFRQWATQRLKDYLVQGSMDGTIPQNPLKKVVRCQTTLFFFFNKISL